MRKQGDYASYDPRYGEDQSPLARMVAEGELVKGGNIVPVPDKAPGCSLVLHLPECDDVHDAVRYLVYAWGGRFGKA